jgi:HSP20 family protein
MSRVFEVSPLRSDGRKEMMSVPDWSSPVDVAAAEEEYLIKIELPGFKREDLKLWIDQELLTLSAERRHSQEEETRNYNHNRIERECGRFVRRFTLPHDANAAQVHATFGDGVLRVHMPKDRTAGRRSIEVE